LAPLLVPNPARPPRISLAWKLLPCPTLLLLSLEIRRSRVSFFCALDAFSALPLTFIVAIPSNRLFRGYSLPKYLIHWSFWLSRSSQALRVHCGFFDPPPLFLHFVHGGGPGHCFPASRSTTLACVPAPFPPHPVVTPLPSFDVSFAPFFLRMSILLRVDFLFHHFDPPCSDLFSATSPSRLTPMPSQCNELAAFPPPSLH